MKLQVASDIHLDVLSFYNPATLIVPSADILILAGDICHISTLEKHRRFFSYVNEHFKKVVMVPGNHEFYNDSDTTIEASELIMRKFLVDYEVIVYLNNSTFIIDNIVIAGTPLWFQTESLHKWFKIPRTTSKEITSLYTSSMSFLKETLAAHSESIVIFITHYPYMYGLEGKEEHLDNLPDVWVFGHTHKNSIVERYPKTDKLVDGEKKTSVFLCNQFKNCPSYNSKFTMLIN